MTVSSFDQRLNRMEWQPGAIPSQKIIDDVLGTSEDQPLRGEWIVAGVVLGMMIGFGIKGTIVPDGPFGADAGMLGFVVGALSLLGAAASTVLATLCLLFFRKNPDLTRFSLFNMLMILVLLIS